MPNGRRKKRVRTLEEIKRAAQRYRATRKPGLPKGVRVVGRVERRFRRALSIARRAIRIVPRVRKPRRVVRKVFRIKVRARR